MATRASTVEETLAWESEQGPRAGIAALLAGLLTLASQIAIALITADAPRVPVLDGLNDALGTAPKSGGLLTERVLFLDEHRAGLLASAAVGAVAAGLIAIVLGYLFSASKSRRPEQTMIGLYIALVAPVLFAVASLVLQAGLAIEAHNFATGSARTTKAAHDALQGSVLTAAQILQVIANLMLSAAFVFIALNAQRVGLLTRFMGVLGMIVGGTNLIGLDQLRIIQCFWLIAVGFLILGRWPSAIPPAWVTGRAEPWPTQQQLREAREAAREGGDVPSAPAPRPDTAPATAHSSSKKKKRKRR